METNEKYSLINMILQARRRRKYQFIFVHENAYSLFT